MPEITYTNHHSKTNLYREFGCKQTVLVLLITYLMSFSLCIPVYSHPLLQSTKDGWKNNIETARLLGDLSNNLQANRQQTIGDQFHQRHLAGVTSSTNSVVSGNGTSSLIYALQTYRIVVTAKDSSGNNINAGGDNFYVKITNKCTQNSNFACTEVAGARQTLTSPIQGSMTDNGDGTYYFDYSVPLDGAVTIVVQLLSAGNVYGEWFANTDCSGSPGLKNYTSNINFDWDGSTPIVSSQSTLVSGKVYAKLKPTVTDTYTFYFTYDDGSTLIINGATKVGLFETLCLCTSNFDMSLISGEYYEIEIFFFQNLYGAKIILEWSSSTISRQVIPSSYYSSPTNVLASPLQVSVDCLTGYTGSNPSSLTTCKEICGDGIKVGSEQCDDGNTVNGDGCSSTCRIETSSACSGGSSTSKDTCKKCTSGYYQNSLINPTSCITKCGDGIVAYPEKCDDGNTSNNDGCSSDCLKIADGWVCTSQLIYNAPYGICVECDMGYINNQDYSKCIDGNLPRDTQTIAIFTYIGSMYGLSSNLLISALTSSTSSQSKFGMINQIQLVLVLPLINCYYPEKVMDFIKAMKSSLFTLSFLPTENSSTISNFKNEFYLIQYNSYLYLLDLKEGSAFVNVLNLSMVVLCVACLHILISFLFLIFYKTSKCSIFKKILSLALAALTFGFYIGVYLECFLLICFVNFNEYIIKRDADKSNNKSLIVTYVLSACIGFFILLTLWQWCKSRNPVTFEKQKYFRALIEGMKPKWIYRSYMLMFLIRRTLFCAVVFFCSSFSLTNKLIMYVSIQGLYFLYVIVLRPLQHKSENIMDIVNEIFYSYYCSFLFFYNTENDWTDTIIDIYFWSLVSNNFVIILITFISSIKTFIEIYRKWRNRVKIAPQIKNNTVTQIDNAKHIETNKVSMSQLKAENISTAPNDAEKSRSYISFIPSQGKNNNSKLQNNFQSKYLNHYQREVHNFREESKGDDINEGYEYDDVIVNRLKKAHEAKANKIKIEGFKEKPKRFNERINQNVNFEF